MGHAKDSEKAAGTSRKDLRDARLAAELRANLKRRKAAARCRDVADGSEEPLEPLEKD
ncbi:MAG: hypothetical protein ABL897_13205 [Hyphomicrobium sp.]